MIPRDIVVIRRLANFRPDSDNFLPCLHSGWQLSEPIIALLDHSLKGLFVSSNFTCQPTGNCISRYIYIIVGTARGNARHPERCHLADLKTSCSHWRMPNFSSLVPVV